jgi:hypothetical protein
VPRKAACPVCDGIVRQPAGFGTNLGDWFVGVELGRTATGRCASTIDGLEWMVAPVLPGQVENSD